MLKMDNSRAKKVMKYFTYQKVNHSLCIEVEVKNYDLIRIVYEKIMLAIGVMIANLVMNETMTVCIVEIVLVVAISLIFDIIQLRNKTQ